MNFKPKTIFNKKQEAKNQLWFKWIINEFSSLILWCKVSIWLRENSLLYNQRSWSALWFLAFPGGKTRLSPQNWFYATSLGHPTTLSTPTPNLQVEGWLKYTQDLWNVQASKCQNFPKCQKIHKKLREMKKKHKNHMLSCRYCTGKYVVDWSWENGATWSHKSCLLTFGLCCLVHRPGPPPATAGPTDHTEGPLKKAVFTSSLHKTVIYPIQTNSPEVYLHHVKELGDWLAITLH